MCDLLLQTIYDKYQEYLSDLSIGYSFSGKRNKQLKDLIHTCHLLNSSELSNEDVLNILNYYEY